MEIQIKFFLKQIINNDENYAHDTTKKVLGEKGTNIFFFKFRVARICFCRLCGLFNIFPKVMMLSGFVFVFFLSLSDVSLYIIVFEKAKSRNHKN